MATVRVDADTLVVEIEGIDKLWALKSRLEIPLANVRGATADPGIAREPKGIRTAGTYLPNYITAGAFRVDGEKVFWDVRDANKAVVIELADERYARLIIEVDDPRATVALVEHSVRR
ncbi:hypothetical protein Dvina_26925 [Dactylosporangium vinaceum]|uniref:Uncharacterized protein n=1 Tax=Dactylosporangium vinaceum TaxID=53362 RepID=A0ABV5MC40_9ACTN|nr:hypothetical protein [Dactylosporangium vinaceum]UAC01352.1 hypothetical protein Dvina_26925 [Dactylosporangium vinaceum]